MKTHYIFFFLIGIFSASCVPTREKPIDAFFKVNYNTTIRGLQSQGYNLTRRKILFPNYYYYHNMRADLEYINFPSSKASKYRDDKLKGKEIYYYFENGTDSLLKREIH